nr:AlNc14C1838G13080 [Albugo laibachii Nc14]|eukprot:CCA28261.1 AlNc14C1838G13080 [Albugo laibachii Nc14]
MDSQRVEITRSAPFQENPKNQYLDVNYNYDSDIPSRFVNRDDDQETVIMMQPVEHNLELMDVDDAGFNSSIINETDADMLPVNQEQAIVPRGRYTESHGCPIFRLVGPGTLPHGEYSQTLVSYETSESIVPQTTEEIRPLKRYLIEYDQANAALEAPTTHEDAIKSPEAEFWKKAIAEELKALK